MVTVAEAAEELYGMDPAGFVARRSELVREARAAKDRPLAARIGELRRPTVAAWYVNLAVRAGLATLDELLAVGAKMRAAQSALDLRAVSALTPRRRELEAQVVREVAALVTAREIQPTPSALAEVSATVTAAVADPKAAEAVRSGCLARSLSYAGFGEVDLSGALGSELEAWVTRYDEPGPSADESPADVHGEETSTSTRGSESANPEPVALRAVSDVLPEGVELTSGAEASIDDDEAAARLALAAAQRHVAQVTARRESAEAARALQAARHALTAAREERDVAQREVDELALALAAARERLAEAETGLNQSEAQLGRLVSRTES